MKKKLLSAVSFILVLTMIMAFPLEVFAKGKEPGKKPKTGPAPEVRTGELDEQTEATEEIALTYPAMPFDASSDGVKVHVDAPEGAFPEGTEMKISVVKNLEAVQEAVDNAKEISGTVVAAVDITFFYEGEEIQPNGAVNVSITSEAISKLDNVTVVHIDEERGAEKVNADSREGVEFDADEFSVYAIIDGDPGTDDDQPYRTTYEFYNADGSKYYFKDAAGKDQYTQILKDGETLEDVGIPTQGASANAKFVGWYDENGNKVEVGEAKSVNANKTIKLTAKLQGIVNVFFVTAVMKDDQGQDMSRSIVTVEQVEYTVGQSAAITVNVNGITTDAPTNEQAVVGWNRVEADANDGTAEGTDGVITLYADGNVESITDVMMFPAIKDAYWLYFDENDGGTGGGASYTPPEFVTVGGKPTRPADPHRSGYTFGGWYKDAACTQEFNFDEVLTATTTIYAKWVGAQTTYTIIVMVQSTSDSAKITSNSNLAHDSKTYDYWRSYTVNSQTGGTATVANTYKTLANQIDTTGYITYETCDPNTTVAADGSTVLYVYYQRQVMTIHWRNSSNGTDRYTWYGLYGASFADSGKTWIEPDNGYRWRTSTMLLTFMDSFKNFNPAGTSLVIYRTADTDSWWDIYFYTENLDGTWKQDHVFEFNANSFQFAEKYDAFTLSQYSRNNTTWSTATVGNSVNRNNQNLYIRYTRNSYEITFHNGIKGTDGTVVKTDRIKYETPLAGHDTPSVSYPVAADADHYEFVGWFADSGWKTMVTFTELDEQTKANYRNWYGIAEFVVISKMPSHNFPLYAGYSLKGWDCALDPNGGEFTSPTQAGVFWLQYGEKFSADLKTNIKREGYIFQGWMLADAPKDAEGNLDIDIVTRDGKRFVGNNSNITMTDEPWQFDTGITGPTVLKAKWFYKLSMSVVYDANGGDNAPIDGGAYSDHATTVAFRAPTPPEGSNFIGWDIVGTDKEEKLQPGATFTVDSEYAVDGVVTLKALYHSFNPEEEVPVTHIDWYANNTKKSGDTLLHVTDDELQLNAGVAIRPSNTFSNFGYKFLGWAKLHKDGSVLKDHNGNTITANTDTDVTVDYLLTEENLYLKYTDGKFQAKTSSGWEDSSEVAADEDQPYDDMYAVWEYVGIFYVFHSSDASVDMIDMGTLSDGKYDLAATVKSGYLYGGYFKGYFNVTDAQAISAAKAGTAVDTETYDGSAIYKKLGGIVRYWTKVGEKGAYTASVDETNGGGIGNDMTPKNGKVYYLREIPTAYLGLHVQVVYDWSNDNNIDNLYLITTVDNNIYSEAGFKVVKDNKATLYSSFSIQMRNSGKDPVKIIAKDINGIGGYVGVWDATSTLITNAQANSEFTVQPYWITLDGIRVDDTHPSRTFNIGDKTYKNGAAPGMYEVK